MTRYPDPLAPVTAIDVVAANRALAAVGHAFPAQAQSMLVAADSTSVSAVLTSPSFAVRPTPDPVAAALAGTVAGSVFTRLARMTDGDTHRQRRRALEQTLSAITPDAVRQATQRALDLSSAWTIQETIEGLGVAAVAILLGANDSEIPDFVRATAAFARGIGPGGLSTPESREATITAAESLHRTVTQLLDGAAPSSPLGQLEANMKASGLEQEDTIANAIGLLFQACDAMAGLIGNALLIRAGETVPGSSSATLIADVLQNASPIQNTRRWATARADLPGCPRPVEPGDAVLVALAAANQSDEGSGNWSFGHGAHACPGEAIARTIAETVLDSCPPRLAVDPLDRETLRYRPSANARIPLLAGDESGGGAR